MNAFEAINFFKTKGTEKETTVYSDLGVTTFKAFFHQFTVQKNDNNSHLSVKS